MVTFIFVLDYPMPDFLKLNLKSTAGIVASTVTCKQSNIPRRELNPRCGTARSMNTLLLPSYLQQPCNEIVRI